LGWQDSSALTNTEKERQSIEDCLSFLIPDVDSATQLQTIEVVKHPLISIAIIRLVRLEKAADQCEAVFYCV
jgi:hypothetical protein